MRTRTLCGVASCVWPSPALSVNHIEMIDDYWLEEVKGNSGGNACAAFFAAGLRPLRFALCFSPQPNPQLGRRPFPLLILAAHELKDSSARAHHAAGVEGARKAVG